MHTLKCIVSGQESLAGAYENDIKLGAVQFAIFSFKFPSYGVHLLGGYTLVLNSLIVLLHYYLADIYTKNALDMGDKFKFLPQG